MPSFVYVGDAGRYYPVLRLTPEPGQVVELDQNPGDGRWQAQEAAQTATTAPEPAPAPSVPDEALQAAQAAVAAADAADEKAKADLTALQAKGNA